ncbi:hypothetical protein [Massilia sp. erpn]|uniref:hypothetical protein n=1 Tax=Massilia sp. erpn TaxID=2738142 RepID=UPI0021079B47|nr:hypothetical protein [Massilia sp. erpn]UTY55847.1 hypothetical protein HPQ68_00795 [Massilia sp. erpn]
MNAVTPAALKNTSFQWMLALDVTQDDVNWLEGMSGSIELHLLGNRERVERIWTTAITGILKSDSPEAHLAHALK